MASFVMGMKSGGGANMSELESGVGNKLQERTGKWGVGNVSKLPSIKRAIWLQAYPFTSDLSRYSAEP